MHRDEVIARLRALKPRLNAEGIARLYLFGSVLRDEAGPDFGRRSLFYDHDLPNFGCSTGLERGFEIIEVAHCRGD